MHGRMLAAAIDSDEAAGPREIRPDKYRDVV